MTAVHTSFVPERAVAESPHGRYEASVAFTCNYCERVVIGRIFSDHSPADPDGQPQFSLVDVPDERIEWVPTYAEGEPFPDVPAPVSEAASEATACLVGGRLRAAVLLARAVIEATAKNNGITEGSLKSKINKMHEMGLIREHIGEVAHEVREFGNEMAHGDFVQPVEPGDADLALQLMREILDEVYASPARLQRVRSRRAGTAR